MQLCTIAGLLFGTTLSFSDESVIAEPLRLFSVALVGLAFYLRQNAKINDLEAKIYRQRRAMTATEIHEAHVLHDLTGQG